MTRPLLLVVDHDPRTRDALQTPFACRGWRVEAATNRIEGLVALDPTPSCIVLSLDLPEGDGVAVLRAVRSRCPVARVAVHSGTSDPRRLAEARGLRPDLLLVGPIAAAPLFRLCQGVSAASPVAGSSPPCTRLDRSPSPTRPRSARPSAVTASRS